MPSASRAPLWKRKLVASASLQVTSGSNFRASYKRVTVNCQPPTGYQVAFVHGSRRGTLINTDLLARAVLGPGSRWRTNEAYIGEQDRRRRYRADSAPETLGLILARSLTCVLLGPKVRRT